MRHPVTGATMHIDLLRVRLDVKIQATVVLELTGIEDARASRRAACSSSRCASSTSKRCRTTSRTSLTHDVSEMAIGDTLTVEALTVPSALTLLDEPETVVATLSPPRLQVESDDEIESETEVVGEGADAAGEAAERLQLRLRVGPRATPGSPRRPRRLADRRAGQPGRRVRADPAQRRVHDRRAADRALAAVQAQDQVQRSAQRGADRHARGRHARPRRGADAADLHERRRTQRRSGSRRARHRALDHVLVLHDEIDIPFGEIRVRLGGGLAGHNGLKSIRDGLGSTEFGRVRVGVDRPPTTDPDRVAAYVLGRFAEPKADVEALVARGRRRGRAGAAGRLSITARVPRVKEGPLMLNALLAHAYDDPQTEALAAAGGDAFVSLSLRPYLIAALLARDPDRPAIVVAGDDRAARDLAAGLRTWLAPRSVRYYPSRGVTYESHLTPPPHLVGLRIAALDSLVDPGRARTARRSWSSRRSRCRRRCPTGRCARTGSCCAPAT